MAKLLSRTELIELEIKKKLGSCFEEARQLSFVSAIHNSSKLGEK